MFKGFTKKEGLPERILEKNPTTETLSVSSKTNFADQALSESEEAKGQFLDRQPAIGGAEHPRDRRCQIVHVDNFPAFPSVSPDVNIHASNGDSLNSDGSGGLLSSIRDSAGSNLGSVAGALFVALKDSLGNFFGTLANAIFTKLTGPSGNTADVTSGGALKVDGSATTQPVSGSVTSKIQDSAGATLSSNGAGALKVDGSATTQPISGSVTSKIQDSAGATLSSNGAGALKVDGSATTQPVSFASFTPTPNSNDSPTGGETAQIVRAISRKRQLLESSTPLGAGATFTGAWHDSELTGDTYVAATSISNTAGASTNGLQLQESEDQTNTRAFAFAGAAATMRVGGYVRARYWRVVYTTVAAQASFSLYTTASSVPFFGNGLTAGQTEPEAIVSGGSATATSDGISLSSGSPILSSGGTGGLQFVLSYLHNGATLDRPRTPSKFKQNTATALGTTTLWTPAAGKKFRLMRFKIQVTDSTTIAVAGLLTISLFDQGADIGLSHVLAVPATGGGVNAIQDYDSGWIDLGNGYLSSASNNLLQINLSVALTAGVVNVVVCGTEE